MRKTQGKSLGNGSLGLVRVPDMDRIDAFQNSIPILYRNTK
jgi:hypothetical protein